MATNYYLIQFGYDNPIELVTTAELAQMEETAIEFDGFSAIRVIEKLTKEQADAYKKENSIEKKNS